MPIGRAGYDVYDLTLKSVDFSGEVPVVLYDEQHRTKTVSEIPHLYVRNMLAQLTGEDLAEPEPMPDPEAEARWRDGPDLIVNGTFEAGDAGRPDGWDPLPEYVSMEREDESRFVRMDIALSDGAIS